VTDHPAFQWATHAGKQWVWVDFCGGQRVGASGVDRAAAAYRLAARLTAALIAERELAARQDRDLRAVIATGEAPSIDSTFLWLGTLSRVREIGAAFGTAIEIAGLL
jgi:hypothetical protein